MMYSFFVGDKVMFSDWVKEQITKDPKQFTSVARSTIISHLSSTMTIEAFTFTGNDCILKEIPSFKWPLYFFKPSCFIDEGFLNLSALFL